ncbi:MAG TPA: hypothetical protein VGQ81_12095 [Acidobacteriota bacterium]|nr:hypothetical protein [Acidobacteriota bacterium]
MPLPLVAGSLDQSIRAWWSSGQHNDSSWQPIESEIRKRVKRRIRRFGLLPQDHEDIISEIFVSLLGLLRSRGTTPIRQFEIYVDRVADNLCKRSIRRVNPVWTQLKDSIVETLRGRRRARGFSIWNSSRGPLAGYAIWEGEEVRWTERYSELQLSRASLEQYLSTGRQLELDDLLSGILNWLGTAVPLNEIVNIIFELKGLREFQPESISDIENVSSAVPPVEPVDTSLLAQLAEAFSNLPSDEASALFLHLQPEIADSLLPKDRDDGMSMAGLRRILGLPQEQIDQALGQMPLRDLQIAALLNIHDETNHRIQQRVINLRQRAIRRLQKCLIGAGG